MPAVERRFVTAARIADRTEPGLIVDGGRTQLPGGGGLTFPLNLGPDAGDLRFWFDDTNGAAKLKIKAKQANGTVVTGELALAP